jgi:hypothetical protein
MTDPTPITSIFRENVPPDYAELTAVFADAVAQAAGGKGVERHGKGLPFERQPLMTELDQMGTPAGMFFQARKKVLELYRNAADRGADWAYNEGLGALVYIASGLLHYRRQLADKRRPT